MVEEDIQELKNRWEQVRNRFQFSPMAETRLTTLAENASAKSWPLRGVDETPAKYFDASFTELEKDFNLSLEQVALLVEILEDTLLFDDGYSAMISPELEGELAENQISSSLRRLSIPEDFPVELTGLAPETIKLCALENIRSVGDFAGFSQRMADNVVLGGDFKSILNALAHADEVGISKFLPIRPGKAGLQFPEAVGILVGKLSNEEQEALAYSTQFKAATIQPARAKALAGPAKAKLEGLLQQLIDTMPTQTTALLEEIQSGKRTPERAFLILDNPRSEHLAVELIRPLLKGDASKSRQSAPATAPAKKRSFWSKLFRRG